MFLRDPNLVDWDIGPSDDPRGKLTLPLVDIPVPIRAVVARIRDDSKRVYRPDPGPVIVDLQTGDVSISQARGQEIAVEAVYSFAHEHAADVRDVSPPTSSSSSPWWLLALAVGGFLLAERR